MHIAAVGHNQAKKQIASTKRSPDLEWAWVGSVEELCRYPDALLYADLDFTPDRARIDTLGKLLPKPVLIHSVTHTLQEIGYPFIRINAWPGFLGRTPAELAVRSPNEEAAVKELFSLLDWPCRIVPDIPGMISGRILAAIINEAWFTLEQGVANKEDIDEAVRLGTHYPFGPFEWGRLIGLDAIYGLLDALARTDDRYRPADALIKAVHEMERTTGHSAGIPWPKDPGS